MPKVELLRDTRIRHKKGETVQVSPAEAVYLISTRSARVIAEQPEAEKRETRKKTAKK